MKNDKLKMVGIPNFGGNLVLRGYDTERDLNKAKKDIERMLTVLSERSVYDIIKFLAPYRAKACKHDQQEYDALTEEYKQ